MKLWQILALDVMIGAAMGPFKYMPQHKAAVCACAKCGTTSLFEYLYEEEFNATWPASRAELHVLSSPLWRGAFVLAKEPEEKKRIMEEEFSFALVRDPKERLISAWRSKFTCEAEQYGRDPGTDVYPKLLLRLANRTDDRTCLDMHEFFELLSLVHRAGLAAKLDQHIIPQDLACFDAFPPEQWSEVTSIENPDAFVALGKQVNASSLKVLHEHALNVPAKLSPYADRILDEITRREYEVIGPYLQEPRHNSKRMEATRSTRRLRA
eukprot:CAMPEP_0170597144 /NCGR_PEP_ID=MMETSP0224-20130122/15546_1 /TAXON_ID=285029 /ORGANISM="Togula jolla, Strain CCCM 725" /LENGTH=266 /DNA_ID=CAMNT_0010921587 /DNA_START=229 /DNA_END=1029 /DNA_ORIENTATION=+